MGREKAEKEQIKMAEGKPSEKEHMKIVIVGHIDHGKSTLIGRIFYDTDSLLEGKLGEIEQASKEMGGKIEFAFVMDHLQEEREQGITIDTAHAFFKTPKREYVIIDAPGHKEFIKNMITGASQAEAAILLVDAEEGVQEQTKRHGYILGMLGLAQVIVAVNKMDLVGYSEERFNEVKKELEKFLSSINISPSCIIPVSAMDGDNIANKSNNLPWFSGPTIIEALDTFKLLAQPVEKSMRYPVQDVYGVGGKKIFVGRVEAGIVKQGQEVVLLPSNSKAKVKSVEEFLVEPVQAEAGKSTGITLEKDLPADRGEVVCDSSNLPETASEFNAYVFWISKEGFREGDSITLKIATEEVPCTIAEISRVIDSSTLEVISENASELKPNEVGEVLIKTGKPVVIESFNKTPALGRFVLVKGLEVSAGGIIA